MSSPLGSSPYKSRNEVFENHKYSLVAFKPGYSLQASELNEIQENILFQNTYNNIFFYDVASSNTINLSSISGDKVFLPSLNDIVISGTLNRLRLDIVIANFKVSEYYRIWAVIDGSILDTLGSNFAKGQSRSYYIQYETSFVLCSSNSSDEGFIFNDNSGVVFSSSSNGADRFKIKNTDASIVNTQELGSFLFKVTRLSEIGVSPKVFEIEDTIGRKRTISF